MYGVLETPIPPDEAAGLADDDDLPPTPGRAPPFLKRSSSILEQSITKTHSDDPRLETRHHSARPDPRRLATPPDKRDRPAAARSAMPWGQAAQMKMSFALDGAARVRRSPREKRAKTKPVGQRFKWAQEQQAAELRLSGQDAYEPADAAARFGFDIVQFDVDRRIKEERLANSCSSLLTRLARQAAGRFDRLKQVPGERDRSQRRVSWQLLQSAFGEVGVLVSKPDIDLLVALFDRERSGSFDLDVIIDRLHFSF